MEGCPWEDSLLCAVRSCYVEAAGMKIYMWIVALEPVSSDNNQRKIVCFLDIEKENVFITDDTI